MIRALVLLLVIAWAGSAGADTRRIAVVVGSNAGNGNQPSLRYAEIDAGKISRVLVELGGVTPADLFLLQGKDRAALEHTLQRAKAKIAGYQRSGLDRVVVIFYYSGHSDGVALELGRDRFTFAALRTWLKDTGADIRIAFVDACKSGALLATKGGTPGPAFQIRLSDDLSSTGEALLTSSAADENALESKEIGGSFFTHHLVSGLRGAADASGDSRVTLTEAYQYAYRQTITTSGATLAGPQHPAYDYRLSGQGELILTELDQPTAALALPAGFDRALVIELGRDQVIAELGRGISTRIAVLPGRYGIRAWKRDRAFEGKVAVATGELRVVREEELHATSLAASRAKGEVTARSATTRPSPIAISVAAGGRAAIANQFDGLAGARLGVHAPGVRGPSLALDASTRGRGMLRETSVFVFAGYRVGLERGRLRAWAGLEIGGGAVVQAVESTSWTGAAAVGPSAGLSFSLAPAVAVAFDAHLPAAVLERDDRLRIVALPAAWLGVIITP